jgi:hypothetical protein
MVSLKRRSAVAAAAAEVAVRCASSALLTRPRRVAQKVRAAIQKELEHIQKGGPGTNEVVRFEKVEKLMEK